MTWQTNDLEAINTLVKATKRGAGIKIEEPVKRRDHTMVNIVFLPTLMIGGLVYLGVMGALLSIYAVWDGWPDRALLIVLGLPWVPACRFSYQRLIAQLEMWNNLQYRVLRASVNDDVSGEGPDDPPIERIDSGHLFRPRAPWISGWKQKLAKRVHDKGHRGQWTGGATIARERHLKGLFGANENYETALDDLRRLGWLDGKKWTDKGKAEIKTYLFYGGNNE